MVREVSARTGEITENGVVVGNIFAGFTGAIRGAPSGATPEQISQITQRQIAEGRGVEDIQKSVQEVLVEKPTPELEPEIKPVEVQPEVKGISKQEISKRSTTAAQRILAGGFTPGEQFITRVGKEIPVGEREELIKRAAGRELPVTEKEIVERLIEKEVRQDVGEFKSEEARKAINKSLEERINLEIQGFNERVRKSNIKAEGNAAVLKKEIQSFNLESKLLAADIVSFNKRASASKSADDVAMLESQRLSLEGRSNILNSEGRRLQQRVDSFSSSEQNRSQKITSASNEINRKVSVVEGESIKRTGVGLNIQLTPEVPRVQDVKAIVKPFRKAVVPTGPVGAVAQVGVQAFESAGLVGEVAGRIGGEIFVRGQPGLGFTEKERILFKQRTGLVGGAVTEIGFAVTPLGQAALATQIPKEPELAVPVLLGGGFVAGARVAPKISSVIGKTLLKPFAKPKVVSKVVARGTSLAGKAVGVGLVGGFVGGTAIELSTVIDQPVEFRRKRREVALGFGGFVAGAQLTQKAFTRAVAKRGLEVEFKTEPAEAVIRREGKVIISDVTEKGVIKVRPVTKPKAEQNVLEQLFAPKTKEIAFKLRTKGVTTETVPVKEVTFIKGDALKGKLRVEKVFEAKRGVGEPIEVFLDGKIKKVKPKFLERVTLSAEALVKGKVKPFTSRVLGKGTLERGALKQRFELGGTTVGKITRPGIITQVLFPSKPGRPTIIRTQAQQQKGVFVFVSEAQVGLAKPVPRIGKGRFERQFAIEQIGGITKGEIKLTGVKARLIDFPEGLRAVKIKATIPKQVTFFTEVLPIQKFRPFKVIPPKKGKPKIKPIIFPTQKFTPDVGSGITNVFRTKIKPSTARVSSVQSQVQARTKTLTLIEQNQIVAAITQAQTRTLTSQASKAARQFLKQSKASTLKAATSGLVLFGEPAAPVSVVRQQPVTINFAQQVSVKPVELQTQVSRILPSLTQETLTRSTERVGTITIQASKVSEKTLIKSATSQLVKQAIKTEQKNKLKVESIQTSAAVQLQITSQKLNQRVDKLTKQAQRSLQVQTPLQVQATAIRFKLDQLRIQKLRDLTTQITSQKLKTPSVPRLSLLPIPITITRPFIFDLPRQLKEKTPVEVLPSTQAFAAFVRIGGKFVRITTPLTLKSALGKGILATETTALRTFKILPVTGKPGKTPLGFDPFKILAERFRKPIRKRVEQLGRAEFIEKTQFAINTQGEREEITFKGLAALRKRKKPKKKKIRRRRK